jgi:hypothetical protein
MYGNPAYKVGLGERELVPRFHKLASVEERKQENIEKTRLGLTSTLTMLKVGFGVAGGPRRT